MGKEERLKRKADKAAAKALQVPTQADVDALKQKSLEEGAYTINPDTGNPVEKTVDPSTQVRMVETTNLKPMEGSSREVVTTTDKPFTTPSEVFEGDRKYLDSVDIQNVRKDVSDALDTKNIAKRGEASGNYQMTQAEMDASIAQNQKEQADLKIVADSVVQKLNNPENADAIEQAQNDMLAANSMVGEEKMQEELSTAKDPSETQKIINTAVQTEDDKILSELSPVDIKKYGEELDYELSKGETPEVVDKYNQYQKVYNKLSRRPEPAIEKQGLTDYYPDMGQPLQVGTYSGSIVGSIPIFTAKGGVLPMNVYDSRRRALQEEATKKTKQKMQLLELAKAQAAPQYQQVLDDIAMSKINQYIQATGGNIVPGDANWMKFVGEINEVNNIKRNTIYGQQRVDKIIKDMAEPDRYVPEYLQKQARKYLEGGFTPEEIMNNPAKRKEFNKFIGGLQSYDNLTHYTADYVKKLKEADAKSTVPLAANFREKLETVPVQYQNQMLDSISKGDFTTFMSLTMKYMPDSDIALHAKKLWENSDFYEKNLGPEKYSEYLEYFNAWIGKEIVPKFTTLKNNNLGWAELAYKKQQDEKAQKPRIYESYKINTFNSDSKQKLIDAAKNGTLKSTLENMTGLGQVKTDKNGNLFQEIKIPVKEGDKGNSSLNDLNIIRVGDKAFKPEQAFNYYSKYSDRFIEKKDDYGNITYDYNPAGGDSELPPLNKEEIKLAEYIAHNKNQGISNIGFNTQFKVGKVYQRSAEGKVLSEEDYKNDKTVMNARPYASYEVTVGIYNRNGNFEPLGTGVKTYDLTNDANVAGTDNFISGSNTEYGYGVKQTTGVTSDINEESDVVNFTELE